MARNNMPRKAAIVAVLALVFLAGHLSSSWLGGLGDRFSLGKVVIKDTIPPPPVPYLVDLPKGWTRTALGPGYEQFLSPDNKSVFLVTHSVSMVVHRKMVQEMVDRYDALRGTAPDKYVSLMPIRRKRVAVTVMGDHPDRVAVYRSIREAPASGMSVWRAD